MLEITWSSYAEITFYEEANFIRSKWNMNEVEIFIDLVNDNVSLISKNPFIGKNVTQNYYSLVISKQTTLYYRIFEEQHYVELLLFWNNLRDPIGLKKYL